MGVWDPPPPPSERGVTDPPPPHPSPAHTSLRDLRPLRPFSPPLVRWCCAGCCSGQPSRRSPPSSSSTPPAPTPVPSSPPPSVRRQWGEVSGVQVKRGGGESRPLSLCFVASDRGGASMCPRAGPALPPPPSEGSSPPRSDPSLTHTAVPVFASRHSVTRPTPPPPQGSRRSRTMRPPSCPPTAGSSTGAQPGPAGSRPHTR